MIIEKMIKTRITSPNNATPIFYNYLESIGVEIERLSKRAYARINGKRYVISITGADKYSLDCRQYEYGVSGLLSMWEANGQIYLVEDALIHIKSKTREMNTKEFISVVTKESISNLTPSVFIKQIDTEDYKDLYIAQAKILADELVQKCTEKMQNRY